MFFGILYCKFVNFAYLWLVPHPTVFTTHLWIHGMCVCMYVCIYVGMYASKYAYKGMHIQHNTMC